MMLEINKLIESEYELLNKVGWLLHGREDQNGGLNIEEVYELVKMINDESATEIYKEGYNSCLSEAGW